MPIVVEECHFWVFFSFVPTENTGDVMWTVLRWFTPWLLQAGKRTIQLGDLVQETELRCPYKKPKPKAFFSANKVGNCARVLYCELYRSLVMNNKCAFYHIPIKQLERAHNTRRLDPGSFYTTHKRNAARRFLSHHAHSGGILVSTLIFSRLFSIVVVLVAITLCMSRHFAYSTTTACSKLQ